MPKKNDANGISRRREILRRRYVAVPGAPSPPAQNSETAPLTRWVTDGVADKPPLGATVADGLRFADGASNRMVMSLYPAPTRAAIQELADAWDLHPMIVEDLIVAQQRPKLDRYGDVVFMAVRSARYIDETEEVEFAEFHIVMKGNAIVVLCQDNQWVDGTAASLFADSDSRKFDRRVKALLSDGELLKLGPRAVAYRLIDLIVDGYAPVLRGISIDQEQIERQVFSGDVAVAQRIYRLSQEIIDMQHTTSSISEVVQRLQKDFIRNGVPDELRAYLEDVADHLTRDNSRVAEYRESLSQILSVNATLVAERQNEDMKKISGWAAILFAPTLIGSIYGMNFDVMPELHWAFGYPVALLAMVALAVLLYWIFKRSKWM
ncbi:Magnesium transport protein CorA [Corynebacterium faecale]|uniref:magnesium and cobalt transport protein CorA n=1 Tax=Corynebacterium faecale TaxID=1758466 RepID=UPI0025B5557A|nr:magnesium and cobalt transport protein CorA [Corynebacterium faecale]WJY90916.1 Magnesium transport protein CorA [Corynebacterium faecale]